MKDGLCELLIIYKFNRPVNEIWGIKGQQNDNDIVNKFDNIYYILVGPLTERKHDEKAL